MITVGLTGGIGSGKSTVAALLAREGFAVVDADQIARQIMEPGSPVLSQVAHEFGEDIVRDDASLDRAKLAQRAFGTEEATLRLNAITHPAIRAESARQFDEARRRGEPVVIYDMPLLVDLGLHRDMDLTVVVDVDPEERVRRLAASRGIAETDARARIARQIPDVQRLAAADVVIDNNGSERELETQVAALAKRLRAEAE